MPVNYISFVLGSVWRACVIMVIGFGMYLWCGRVRWLSLLVFSYSTKTICGQWAGKGCRWRSLWSSAVLGKVLGACICGVKGYGGCP